MSHHILATHRMSLKGFRPGMAIKDDLFTLHWSRVGEGFIFDIVAGPKDLGGHVPKLARFSKIVATTRKAEVSYHFGMTPFYSYGATFIFSITRPILGGNFYLTMYQSTFSPANPLFIKIEGTTVSVRCSEIDYYKVRELVVGEVCSIEISVLSGTEIFIRDYSDITNKEITSPQLTMLPGTSMFNCTHFKIGAEKDATGEILLHGFQTGVLVSRREQEYEPLFSEDEGEDEVKHFAAIREAADEDANDLYDDEHRHYTAPEEIIIPDGLLYSRSHSWIKLDAGIATVGLTDLALYIIGKITDISIRAGSRYHIIGEKTMRFTAVMRVKGGEDKLFGNYISPISGSIVEYNPLLLERGEEGADILNKDPYDKGWLLKIKPTAWDEEEKHLFDAAGYRSAHAELIRLILAREYLPRISDLPSLSDVHRDF
nr:hypothetical protein [Candidatus Sigynarchaeota archaeon]